MTNCETELGTEVRVRDKELDLGLRLSCDWERFELDLGLRLGIGVRTGNSE